jgi:predicted ArsR family transcriptional regulator
MSTETRTPPPTAHFGSSRIALLDVLRHAERPMTVPELAAAVGLHVNTVRPHVDRLVRDGFAVRGSERRTAPGRPHVVYTLAPAGPHHAASAQRAARSGASDSAHDGEGYRFLATVLAAHIASRSGDPAAEGVAAGRDWGRWLVDRPAPSTQLDAATAVARVMRVLEHGGFDPELAADGSVVRLHRCPFRRLAEAQSGVVCGVHLGILRGALDELDAPLEASRLEPFVRPDLCLVHLEQR